jgi:hypothetical protein
VLESASGEWITLRSASGRECCRYVFRLSELEHDGERRAPSEERLFYSGEATRIGRDGAVTAMQREAISRTVTSTPTAVHATLGLERSAGPSIGSPGWEQLPELEAELGESFDDRAKRAWEMHLDQLRAQGARLAVGTASETATLSHHEELVLRLTVTRECDAEQPVIAVSGECRVSWEMRRTESPLHRAEARLAAWVMADDLEVVASSPSSPPNGLESWQVIGEHPDHGVSLVCDSEVDSAFGEWSGRGAAEVTKPDVTIRMGSGVVMEATAAHEQESQATLHARAGCLLHVRIHPPPVPSATSTSAAGEAQPPAARCACAGSTMELTLGIPWPGESSTAADSTDARPMRLDARAVRLGRGAQATWRVVDVDWEAANLDVQESEGIR